MAHEHPDPHDAPSPKGPPGTVNVVNHDTVGVVTLAVIALLLLFAMLRAHGRNRKLLEKLVKQGK